MSGFHLFDEISRVTRDWQEAQKKTDKVLDKMLNNAGTRVGGSQPVDCEHVRQGMTVKESRDHQAQIPAAPAVPAPLTFADLSLGDEFYDLETDDGICYEKRSETMAECWDGDRCDRYDFRPTDRVRMR